MRVPQFAESHQKTVNFSWIERQASRIACASLALAPIVPPSPLALIRSQNQVPPLLQIAKSTPKWRLRLHKPRLIIRLLVKIRAALNFEAIKAPSMPALSH